MAATRWLDIRLTLDRITWHFGNFGEPGLVAATEAGLRELGLHQLASCFVEARDLMVPRLAQRTQTDGDAYKSWSELALEHTPKFYRSICTNLAASSRPASPASNSASV